MTRWHPTLDTGIILARGALRDTSKSITSARLGNEKVQAAIEISGKITHRNVELIP
jgi:hypothetical protein